MKITKEPLLTRGFLVNRWHGCYNVEMIDMRFVWPAIALRINYNVCMNLPIKKI